MPQADQRWELVYSVVGKLANIHGRGRVSMVKTVSEQKDDFEWEDDYYKGPTKVHSQACSGVVRNQTRKTGGGGVGSCLRKP